jgi:hypothetical protein
VQQYQQFIYYNISLPIDESTFAKIKRHLGISFSDVGCENRDAPFCDKILGVPVMGLLIFVFFAILAILVILIIGGLLVKKVRVQ